MTALRYRPGPGLWVALLALLLAFAGPARGEVAVPPVARVTDLTGTLSATERANFDALLAAYEVRKGSQIAVLIVPTTQPETVEQYAIRVADAWKLGRKGVDDGVLLLVAKDDRKMRIEVGRGLEGVLPDVTAKRILHEDLAPRFRQGDFAGGIQTALIRIMSVVDGEALPAPPAAPADDPGAHGDLEALFVIGIIVVVVVGSILRAVIGRIPAATVVGLAAGGIAWMIVGMILVGAVVGVIAFVFTVASGGRGRGPGGRSGWSSGSWGGSSGGGWSGGGGGGSWSGGGGGFGGGGASGDW